MENDKERIIYVYSDESGTFDYVHNDYFLFAGLIFFGQDEKEIGARKYSHVEKCIRGNQEGELKGTTVSNKKKGKLYRSLNNNYKFCVLIHQKNINRKIFIDKKTKQRYLDYAYKIIIKKCMEELINHQYIKPKKVKFMFINADEHYTSTDGIYELRESLLVEFKTGMFNHTWEKHYPPIFPRLQDVIVKFYDSKDSYLIRAADIICNHCYHVALTNNGDLDQERNMFIYYLPGNYIGHNGLEYFENKETNLYKSSD